MKVLQVYSNFNPSKGGVERHIDGICRCINSKFKITYIYKKSDKDAHKNIRYNVIKFNFFNFINKIYNTDLIHIHGARSFFNLKFLILGIIFKKKIIYTPHCYYDGRNFINTSIKILWDLIFEKMFYKFSNYTILLNNYWLNFANKKKFNTSKIKIIPNCVIGKNIKSLNFKKENNKRFNILSISRIDKVKRIEDVIKVIKDMQTKYFFHIIGEGPELQNLKKKYKHISNVKFYGYLLDDQIENIFQITDAFILPSEKEGMPTTIIEMILRGIPVIASNIPGNISILKNLNDDLIFEIGDLKKISKILLKKKFKISEELKENVMKNFTWENRIVDIEKLYTC